MISLTISVFEHSLGMSIHLIYHIDNVKWKDPPPPYDIKGCKVANTHPFISKRTSYKCTFYDTGVTIMLLPLLLFL